MQPRETDCVGRAWWGRGLRDRHPSTTRPTARSLPLGARAPGRPGGASAPSRSHQSENVFGAPGRPDGAGRHASGASAESHSVTSPRWTTACSYADPCPTRSFVVCCGWTFDLISRSCTRSGHRGQRADSCLVAAEGCRVAPRDCSPEALTRTGLGGFHHPALPLMWLMAMRPRFARESEARAEDIVPTTQRTSARGPLPFELLVT